MYTVFTMFTLWTDALSTDVSTINFIASLEYDDLEIKNRLLIFFFRRVVP